MKKVLIILSSLVLVLIGVFGYSRAAMLDSAYGSGHITVVESSSAADPNDIEIRVGETGKWYKFDAPLGTYSLSESNPSVSYDIYIRNNNLEPAGFSGELPKYKLRVKNLDGDAGRVNVTVSNILGGDKFKQDMNLGYSDASFWGEDSWDFSGSSVSGVGDVNNDGYDDFIIGAREDEENGGAAGQVYLVFGDNSGWGMNTDLGSVDASFRGEDGGDQAGVSVSGVGDVNNDGYDDFVIGAPNDEEGGTYAGQTYLIMGKSGIWSMDTDLGSVDASFIGENAGDKAGFSVSGVGDVNNDGYDDFMIGAPKYGQYGTGRAYLILGKSSGWGMDTDLSSADAIFYRASDMDETGYSVSGAGDVDDDGYDDFIIGAKNSDSGGVGAGQAYLILGKNSGWGVTDLANADASFLGESSNDQAGYSVSGVGDVDADGYDDFIIGAPENETGGSYAGQTYLILGKSSGWSMNTNLSSANASFVGEDDGDYSGTAVSGAGDVNGDGYDDFIIGAGDDEEGGSHAGQTYLILGKKCNWAMDTDLNSADASFWGEDADDRAGYSVSGVGDVNSDGLDDFAIGADQDEDGGNGAGQTYLLFGRAGKVELYSGTLADLVNATDPFRIGYAGYPDVNLRITLILDVGGGSGDEQIDYKLEIFEME